MLIKFQASMIYMGRPCFRKKPKPKQIKRVGSRRCSVGRTLATKPDDLSSIFRATQWKGKAAPHHPLTASAIVTMLAQNK